MVKDTIKRKKPSFNEGYYGYRTFSEMLEDAQREGLIELDKHKTSGMYIVTRFGLEMKSGVIGNPPAAAGNGGRTAARPPEERRERPRAERPERGGRAGRPGRTGRG